MSVHCILGSAMHSLLRIIITHRLKNGLKEANKCVKVTVKTAKKDPETSEGEVN